MLNIDYPKIEEKKFPNLEVKMVEPTNKINLRGKNRDFFTKIGKILSIVLPQSQTRAQLLKILMHYG